MEPNRLPLFGANEGTYLTSQPVDHTDVCWAATIGGASRGHSQDPAGVIVERALGMIADGTAGCICSRPKAKRRGRR